MRLPSHLRGCTRRSPVQRRGHERVSQLVGAAVAEFTASGYDAATMEAIARRAKAPIGSLYQFFPNKPALARALRARQIADCEALWCALREEPACRSLDAFVARFTALMVGFVRGHPAFVHLLDAPSSTIPAGARDRLRKLLESLLAVLQPGLRATARRRIAEVILNLNKALMGMYARAAAKDRNWITAEYRAVLRAWLATHVARGAVAAGT
jgi:AcrR family transcriptional regulator